MSMKAARIHAFGPPEVIFLDDIPKPVPAEGQVIGRSRQQELGHGMPGSGAVRALSRCGIGFGLRSVAWPEATGTGCGSG